MTQRKRRHSRRCRGSVSISGKELRQGGGERGRRLKLKKKCQREKKKKTDSEKYTSLGEEKKMRVSKKELSVPREDRRDNNILEKYFCHWKGGETRIAGTSSRKGWKTPQNRKRKEQGRENLLEKNQSKFGKRHRGTLGGK